MSIYARSTGLNVLTIQDGWAGSKRGRVVMPIQGRQPWRSGIGDNQPAWREPLRSARVLVISAAVLVVAFGALYWLEDYQ